MSGTFKHLKVPPTLISFAVTTGNTENTISNDFKKVGSKVIVVNAPMKEDFTPDFKVLNNNYRLVSELIKSRKILASGSINYGGALEAISKMCFGNNIGIELNDKVSMEQFKGFGYGSIILEVNQDFNMNNENIIYLGDTIEEHEIVRVNEKINLNKLASSYEDGLEEIFNKNYGKDKINHLEMKDEILIDRSKRDESLKVSPMIKIAKPKVLIPIFPGTNCEYDCERAFLKAGALVETVIFNNLSPKHIGQSILNMEKNIKESQIIMLPGGFSAGDEPDGSGKFINAIFRNERVKNAVMELLNNRDGLMLGICNGFQALIKLGLVPYGEIRDIVEDSPTLTHNLIGSHQSTMVNTKIVSNKSPWLSECNEGEIYKIPISHGEGRFVANENVVRELFKNGQVATQYVDNSGNPTYDISFNPNGSVYAIEGITSIDGRVFGKMAHSERVGNGVIKNVLGEHDMKIFHSGVKYFK